MLIRPFYHDDIPEIARLASTLTPFAWTEKTFLDCFKPGYYHWVAVDDQQKIQGFLLIFKRDEECELLNIGVSLDCQRQGLGRQLLEHLIQFAKKNQIKIIMLEVRRSNENAISFYQKNGFEQVGVRRNYYPLQNNAREDALLFSLGAQF